MMLFKIAFRNIFRNRRRSLFTGATICFGFAMVSISFGFSDGGYSKIINMITNEKSGHLQIHAKGYLESPSFYKTLPDFNLVSEKLENEKYVVSYAPRIYSGALGFSKNKSVGVELMGVDPAKEDAATTLFAKLTEGTIESLNGSMVFISKGLGDILRTKMGDEIVLISQGADGSIANDIFTVAGILNTQNSTLSSNLVVMSLASSQEFLGLGSRIHEVAVMLESYDRSRQVADSLAKVFPGELEIHPWEVVQESFYRAMLADQKGSYVTLFIIMFVVAVGVLNAVLMSVFERMREYGLLRAMGTRPREILKMIILENMLLAFMSMFFAVVLSIALNLWFSHHGISFDPPIEYGGVVMQDFTSVVNARSIWIPIVVVIFTTFVVSFFPALRAARVMPSKTLRDI